MPEEQDTLQQMSAALDGALLNQVQDGLTVVDKEGGEHHIPVTAAVMAVARNRLKDCGITEAGVAGSSIADLAESMPPIDMYEEDAATA